MKITHFTPGTGHFYCGSCLRDNALGSSLRDLGHDVVMVPLYLPFKLEDDGSHPQAEDSTIFLGGINMYLQQKLPILKRLPKTVKKWLDSPRLLRWAASKGDMTDPAELGRMAVSMVRGDDGRHAAGVRDLGQWLRSEDAPDILGLSNIMLAGIVHHLKDVTDKPVLCSLQGEIPFLETLPEPYRTEVYEILKEKVREIDAFTAVSGHYGDVVAEKLSLPKEKIHVVHNGIDVSDFAPLANLEREGLPVIGFLARLCPDKGLDTLVDAFIHLRKQQNAPQCRLHVAGVMLDADRAFVEEQRRKLRKNGLLDEVTISPNVSKEEKLKLLSRLSVLSVPATYGESFGLYILEALASGVPVVQPRHGAFPEVLEATGGGLLCEPNSKESLASTLEALLRDADRRRELAASGGRTVRERFRAQDMATRYLEVCHSVLSSSRDEGQRAATG